MKQKPDQNLPEHVVSAVEVFLPAYDEYVNTLIGVGRKEKLGGVIKNIFEPFSQKDYVMFKKTVSVYFHDTVREMDKWFHEIYTTVQSEKEGYREGVFLIAQQIRHTISLDELLGIILISDMYLEKDYAYLDELQRKRRGALVGKRYKNNYRRGRKNRDVEVVSESLRCARELNWYWASILYWWYQWRLVRMLLSCAKRYPDDYEKLSRLRHLFSVHHEYLHERLRVHERFFSDMLDSALEKEILLCGVDAVALEELRIFSRSGSPVEKKIQQMLSDMRFKEELPERMNTFVEQIQNYKKDNAVHGDSCRWSWASIATFFCCNSREQKKMDILRNALINALGVGFIKEVDSCSSPGWVFAR